jgi:nascent polypeptide-associated complex subunit beta
VQASVASNTFVINGAPAQKDMAQLLPGILTQLGPESLAELKKLAEQFQAAQLASKGEADDDDVPDLVDTETFDQQE